MLTKLTLTIEESVVEQAKEYARSRRRSVSRIVEEYLENLSGRLETPSSVYSLQAPLTDSISGMFTDSGKPYKEMLEEALLEKHT